MENDNYQTNQINEEGLNQSMFNYLKKHIQGKISGELIYLKQDEIDKYCITYSNLQKLSQEEKNRNIKTIVVDDAKYVIVFNKGMTAVSMNESDEYVYQSINNSSSLMKIRKEGIPSDGNQITPTGVKFISVKTATSEVVRKNLFTNYNKNEEVSVMEQNTKKEDVLSILNGGAPAQSENINKVDLGTKRGAKVTTKAKTSARANRELYASIAESLKVKVIATSGELTVKGYVKKINSKTMVEGKNGQRAITMISDDFKNLIINKVETTVDVITGKTKEKGDNVETLSAEEIVDRIEKGTLTARSVKDQLGLDTDKIEMYVCRYAPYIKESKATAIGAFISVPAQFDKTYCSKSTIDMAALSEDIENGDIKKFISASDDKIVNFFPLKTIVSLAKKIPGIEIEGTDKVIDYNKTITRTKAEGFIVYMAKNHPGIVEAVIVKEGLAQQTSNSEKQRILDSLTDPAFSIKKNKEIKSSFIKSLLEQMTLSFTNNDYTDELKELLKACFRYSVVVVERGEDGTTSKKNNLIYNRDNFFPFKYAATIDLEKVDDIKAVIADNMDSFNAFMSAIDTSYKGAAKGQTKRGKFLPAYANTFREGSLVPVGLENGDVESLRREFLIQAFDGKWYGTPNKDVQAEVEIDANGNPVAFPGHLRILKVTPKVNSEGNTSYSKTSLDTIPTLKDEDIANNVTLEAKMAEQASPFVSGYYAKLLEDNKSFLDVEAIRSAVEILLLTQKNEKATKSKAQKYNDALDKLDMIIGD